MRLARFGLIVMAVQSLVMLVAAHEAAAVTRVYLLRGLGDVSTGLDELALKFKRIGMPAVVASHTDASVIADRVMAESRPGDSIVLIGHSLGADASVDVARVVSSKGVKIDLLVAFSPASSSAVPANVRHAVNYYQSSSFWNYVWTPGPGFRGRLRNVDLVKDDSVHHFNIEKLARLHTAVLGFARNAGTVRAASQEGR